MKALILGGATGLLGRMLTRTLAGRGWETETLGRQDGNILDEGFLAAHIEAARADVVFNAIAWTQVDDAEDHPEDAQRINRGLPAAVAGILATLGRGLLAHYGTDFVFSGPRSHPWTEEDTPSPASVYGRTKLEGEEAVLRLLPDRSCILRTAWLFGPGRKNFVSTILDACRRRDQINVVHDQIGSPSYTGDVALWSAMLAEAWVGRGAGSGVPGIWHVADNGEASWCDLACEAVQLSGAGCRVIPIPGDEWPQKARRPAYSALDTDKLSSFLGEPIPSWPKALRRYLFCEEDASPQQG